jgi:tRNA 2-thiouridine synthesizing protein B
MSTLHIVSSSPFDSNAFSSALKTASQGDAILLIENGVYAAVDALQIDNLMSGAMSDVTHYVLTEDVDARALPRLRNNIAKVDYAGFVALVCQHHNSVSWN